MKFAMGAETLTQLTKMTTTSTDDLGGLVKELATSGESLEGQFNGGGRAAFDEFKARTDEIANELNAALAAVLGGIQGQNVAYTQGMQQMADETRADQSSVSFDAARFSTQA